MVETDSSCCTTETLIRLAYELNSCTEALSILARNSSNPDFVLFQWWIDGINDPNKSALDQLRRLEGCQIGYFLSSPMPKAAQQVAMKDVYPEGPDTEDFQNELSSRKRVHEAGKALASLSNFDPCSKETSLYLDGMLGTFGVKGDDQVDELLQIDHYGVWETLDLSPINYEADNLPGPPADDESAIEHIIGFVALKGVNSS